MRAGAVLVLLLALGCGGCFMGKVAPGWVRCGGSGNVTVTGSIGGGMLYGGGGVNTATVAYNCANGSYFQQGEGPLPSDPPASANQSVTAPPK